MYIIYIFLVQVLADTLEIEINGIEKNGNLNLVIYDSKEAFETYKVEKSGIKNGIHDKLVKKVSKGIYIDTLRNSGRNIRN